MSDESVPAVVDESELALQRAPQTVVAEAHEAAKVLKDVITKTGSSTKIGPKEHIHIEGWQTVAKFYGLSARVVNVKYVEYGEAKGFNAVAEVIDRAGNVITSAESMCMTDESTWRNRNLYALKSMAQTRACGKAFRNCLSWVVVLAGYSGTPSEEMPTTVRDVTPGRLEGSVQPSGDQDKINPPDSKGDATDKQVEAMKKLLKALHVTEEHDQCQDVSDTLGFNEAIADLSFLDKMHASIIIPALGERLDQKKADEKEK